MSITTVYDVDHCTINITTVYDVDHCTINITTVPSDVDRPRATS